MKIIVSIFLLLFQKVLTNDFLSMMKSLEENINPSTVIYFDLKETSILEKLLRQSTLPHLLVRAETNSTFSNLFHSNVLSVIFVEEYHDTSLMATLETSLQRWHNSDIVFVTPLMKIEGLNWKWIFEWCWSKGFYKVLLVSSNPKSKALLRFIRFPDFNVRNTTRQEYFTNIRNTWDNFRGYPIRAGVYHNPPRSIVYENFDNSRNRNMVMDGIFYQPVKLFAERHNAGLVYTTLSSSIKECYEMLRSGKLDICTQPAFYAPGLPAMVIFPNLFAANILVPHAQPLDNYKYYLLPFDNGTWCAIVLTAGFLAIATSLLHLRHMGATDLSGSFLTAFEMILYSGFRLPGSGKCRLFLFFIAVFNGFIITNLYLARLSSFLSTSVYDKQIETYDDLSARNITVIYSSLWKEVVQTSHIAEVLGKQMKAVDHGFIVERGFALDTSYAYLCPIEICEFVVHQQLFMTLPRLKIMSKKPVFELGGGYPIRIAWPFDELFKQFLLSLYAFGIFDNIDRQCRRDAVKRGLLKLRRDVVNDVKPLAIEDFQVMIIILAIGYAAALTAFCLENLNFYARRLYRNARETKGR